MACASWNRWTQQPNTLHFIILSKQFHFLSKQFHLALLAQDENKNLPFKSVKRINFHHFIRIYNNRRFLKNRFWPLENGSLTDYDSYEIGNRVREAEYHDIGCVDYCERLIICYLPFDFWIRLLNLLYSIISVCNSLKVPYFTMEIGMNSDN